MHQKMKQMRYPVFGRFIQSVFGLSLLLIGMGISIPATADDITRTHHYAWEKSVGYTQLVEANNTVYVSGIISSASSYEDQLGDVYTQLVKLLETLDLTMDSIVKETIYTLDIEQLKRRNSLRKAFYNKNVYPSSTWVQVERLYFPQNLIEVEVIAVR